MRSRMDPRRLKERLEKTGTGGRGDFAAEIKGSEKEKPRV